MAGTRRGLLLAVVLVAVAPASAKDYTVGESSGWATGVDYSAWTKDETFHIGDTLSFRYNVGHSVVEVSAADHGACSTSKPLRSYTGQSTTIQLTRPGTRYFICGTSGHCASGMKLAVTVSGSRSSAPATSGSTVLSAKPSKPTGTDEPSSGSETTSAVDTTAASGSSSKLNSNTSDAAGSGARLATVLLLLVAVGLSCLLW